MKTIYNKSEKIWVAPDSEYTLHCGLGEAILAKLEKDDQERVLEVFYDNGTQLTVGDIRRQTITVAQNMQRLGVKKGDTVVVYSLFNEKLTPITFACYTIGAPINFFDTNFEGDDIDHLLQQLDPKLIIFQEQYRQKLFSSLERIDLPNLKHILGLGTIAPSVNDELFTESEDIDSFQVPDIGDPTIEPAALMLTSGTTGRPKVIILSHALMFRGVCMWQHIDFETKILVPTQPRWIGPILAMMQPVFLGYQRFYTAQTVSGVIVKDIIDTCKITNIIAVSTIYRALLAATEASGDASRLSSLKVALVSGEAISEQLIDSLTNAMPNCHVVKCYGMTELGGLVTSVDELSKRDVQGGPLINGFMVKVNDEDGNPLGPNEMGQLVIKSTLPFLGYLKNDKANKESYLEDGWFNTGDYGYMDSDNLLNVITRYKFLVRSGGKIIIPMVIEEVIMAHPNVVASALVGHPNPENPNEEIGTIFVVLKNDTASTNIEDELRELILNKCTKDQAEAVRNVRFIQGLPPTSCGKIDRILLKKMASETK